MGSRFICCLLFAALAFGQEKPQPRVIEVRGSAEKLVTPNEFTFKIVLVERYEKKEKVTLEDQEKRLREELTKAGIEAQKDLTVFDLVSSYSSYRRLRKQKDELASRDYRLKLADAQKIDKLQDIANELEVSRLELLESTSSDMAELRKEVKIEAVKAAQAKAAYLLSAIGDKLGKTAYIQELPEAPEETAMNKKLFTNSFAAQSVAMAETVSTEPPLTFSQIKLRYVVLARFEIE